MTTIAFGKNGETTSSSIFEAGIIDEIENNHLIGTESLNIMENIPNLYKGYIWSIKISSKPEIAVEIYEC